ncbi:hypothetical protein [Streptomyces sp. NPDC048445]|uniref:hypothetical protein n=1 Tax=Streptomyces sp. NPDC048445 TaxID=3365553 RepID=UPI0037166D23
MPSSPRLVTVTSDNVEDACALRVRPDQDGLVKPVARSVRADTGMSRRVRPVVRACRRHA